MAYLFDMNTTNLGVNGRIKGIRSRIGDSNFVLEMLIFISFIVTFDHGSIINRRSVRHILLARKIIISASQVTHHGKKVYQQLEGFFVFVVRDQVDRRKLSSRIGGRGGQDCVLYGVCFEVHVGSVIAA